MRKIMSSIRHLLMNVNFILMLMLMPALTSAQASGWIKTCYQNIFFNGNKTIKLLNMDGNSVFSYASTAGTSLNYFAVRKHVSGGFEYIVFPDHPSTVVTGPAGPITIYENSTPTITIPTESVIIDLYDASGMFSLSLNVDFINVNEAFSFKPFGQSCFTYDNFRINRDITNLEGFCLTPWYYIKVPNGATDTKGLSRSFRRALYFYNSNPASDPINIPINQEECSNPNYACQAADPCGCIDLEIAIAFRSCYSDSFNKRGCRDIKEVYLPIKVCCRCGSNSNPDFPTMGRKTDNTDLTGKSDELSIFPNPNHNGKLEITAANGPVLYVRIYAVDGRLVKELSIEEANQNKVSVDISGLKPGLYQVKLWDSNNTVSSQKLVVQ